MNLDWTEVKIKLDNMIIEECYNISRLMCKRKKVGELFDYDIV